MRGIKQVIYRITSCRQRISRFIKQLRNTSQEGIGFAIAGGGNNEGKLTILVYICRLAAQHCAGQDKRRALLQGERMPIQTAASASDSKHSFFAQYEIGIQHCSSIGHRQCGFLADAQGIAHIQRSTKFNAVDIELENIKDDGDIGALLNLHRTGGDILAQRHSTFACEAHIIPRRKGGCGVLLIHKGFVLRTGIPGEAGTAEGEILRLSPDHTATK